jgi:hypothetical protein
VEEEEKVQSSLASSSESLSASRHKSSFDYNDIKEGEQNLNILSQQPNHQSAL